MLNIRIQFAINLKKVAASLGTAILVLSHLMSSPASATTAEIFAKKFSVNEKVVRVSLAYLNVQTTRSESVKVIKSSYTKYFDPQTLAFFIEYASGASMAQWKCLNTLWWVESHFNPKALNMDSHAFGIAQFLPSTWANYNVTKTPLASLQIKYGLHYIKMRYGTPCAALAFHNVHNWY